MWVHIRRGLFNLKVRKYWRFPTSKRTTLQKRLTSTSPLRVGFIEGTDFNLHFVVVVQLECVDYQSTFKRTATDLNLLLKQEVQLEVFLTNEENPIEGADFNLTINGEVRVEGYRKLTKKYKLLT